MKLGVARIPRKWRNIWALHVKAPKSITLPLCSATVDADGNAKGRKWDVMEEEHERVKRKNSSIME
ncbi:hypothetical protein ABZP36_003136, partial [Zizania latifolia]